MKILDIISLLYGLACLSQVWSQNVCKGSVSECNNEGALFPKCTSCSMFIVCLPGSAAEGTCPPGQEYSSLQQLCVPAAVSDCVTTPMTSSTTSTTTTPITSTTTLITSTSTTLMTSTSTITSTTTTTSITSTSTTTSMTSTSTTTLMTTTMSTKTTKSKSQLPHGGLDFPQGCTRTCQSLPVGLYHVCWGCRDFLYCNGGIGQLHNCKRMYQFDLHLQACVLYSSTCGGNIFALSFGYSFWSIGINGQYALD